MQKNIGSVDRVARLALSFVIFMAGVYFKSPWGLLGLIPLGTALFHWCPLYIPFGISTRK